METIKLIEIYRDDCETIERLEVHKNEIGQLIIEQTLKEGQGKCFKNLTPDLVGVFFGMQI